MIKSAEALFIYTKKVEGERQRLRPNPSPR